MAVALVPINKGRVIVLDKAVVFIGRHADCDVVLNRSRKVSRKHCCIAQVDDRILIRDLGSLNGVRVNGERIRSEQPLELGDEVAIGDLEFVVQAHNGKGGAEAAGSRKREAAAKEDEPSGEMPVVVPEPADGPQQTPDEIPAYDPSDDGDDVRLLSDDEDSDGDDPRPPLQD